MKVSISCQSLSILPADVISAKVISSDRIQNVPKKTVRSKPMTGFGHSCGTIQPFSLNFFSPVLAIFCWSSYFRFCHFRSKIRKNELEESYYYTKCVRDLDELNLTWWFGFRLWKNKFYSNALYQWFSTFLHYRTPRKFTYHIPFLVPNFLMHS